ncbi:MAG: nucleotidyltransferase domain-containing protein [Actinomycetota bacterium]|nr:nucleotidyltransferase domain-containing protein [Actinomycetota bacterium]
MSSETEYTSSLNELAFHAAETPTSQERVFGLLLDEAGDELTEAQVREMLDVPKSTVHVALAALVQDQLVASRNVGRTKLYWVDTDDPLIKTLKIAQAIRRVRTAIAPVRDKLDLAILYGSSSRGENRSGSDVDVLVVADDAESVMVELAQHQWLQPVVLTPESHMQLIAEAGTFASEVARGITVLERR